jgi:hypothetical protein
VREVAHYVLAEETKTERMIKASGLTDPSPFNVLKEKPQPREWYQVRYKQNSDGLYCTVKTRKEAEDIVRQESNEAFAQFDIVHVREVLPGDDFTKRVWEGYQDGYKQGTEDERSRNEPTPG